MKLLGIDVGFSRCRSTTGIAALDGKQLQLSRVGSSWESRRAALPVGFEPDFVAIDGPIVPDGGKVSRRYCEWLFVHAPFHSRCKPGFSHFGQGLELRAAAAETYRQCRELSSLEDRVEAIRPEDSRIVEAFPNAFLGVMTPDDAFCRAPRGRGRRFDWLYDQVASTGELRSRLSQLLDLDEVVWRELMTEVDHEKRAALICLLTAALRATNQAFPVGDDIGGWFWLPPTRLWRPWAREGLESSKAAISRKVIRELSKR